MSTAVPLLSAALVALAVLVWPGALPDRGPGPAVMSETTAAGGAAPASSRTGAGGGAARVRPARRPRSLRERLPRRLRPRSAGRVGPVEEVQLLDGLAAALEAGLPTEQAVRVALAPLLASHRAPGPWWELARAAGEAQPLGPSWQRLARRTGSPTAASVARAWTLASATGAPVAAAVRSSAHAARERRRLERAVEVATAGARATATVLGLLPLAGVGLAALLGVGPLTLYSHPWAVASASLGVVLLIVGHLTVRRMVGGVLGGVA